ncbi:unnamed protein product [Didymodactylos carnosus]|uniref:peptidylprolyl isomerase n=1 Tax=Didymodactylos carnosus TaxID=1234261 RepID=A0A814FSJ6_9BILA|nr:unnamed protein product [Didymodactylos carnosus]CAF1193265.1 unnamed protein product [Didymodactylos carnosus]CAF3761036.1 unnamed protein product [Didymodactylos carnosus]CAF4003595.1 unnamed protein product [Didymodactylos carnosus]
MAETKSDETSVKSTPQIELKGEDITPNKDGGVLKEILKEGHDNEQPAVNDKVSVHYVGTLLDGTKFDSSRDRNEKFEFDLGKGSVIKAWDIGVATMKRGEICRLICKPEYAYGKAGSGANIPPDSTLVFEIELFNFVGEDISEAKDQSVIRRILTKGDEWSHPNDGASVEVSLKGTYEGRVFDERTVSFVMGEGVLKNIIPGVEHTITKMLKNERCKITVKSKAAWGKDGEKTFNIPPHANVEYEILLKSFEKAKDSWQMNDNEKLEQAEVLKKSGASLFKDGHFRVALKKYSTIVDYLQSANFESDNDKDKCRQLKLTSHSNIALCNLKLEQYVECINACEKALELDGQNEKCLFRRGEAYLALNDFDVAVKDFQAVLKINPSNSAAKQQIQKCQEKIKLHTAKEKRLYAKLFEKLAVEREKEELKESKKTAEADSKKNVEAEKEHKTTNGERNDAESSATDNTSKKE